MAKSYSQKDKPLTHVHEAPTVVKSIETERRVEATRGKGEGGKVSHGFMGTEFQLGNEWRKTAVTAA